MFEPMSPSVNATRFVRSFVVRGTSNVVRELVGNTAVCCHTEPDTLFSTRASYSASSFLTVLFGRLG